MMEMNDMQNTNKASDAFSVVPYPFQDATLAMEARISDLLGRMTLEEKARQLDIYSSNEFSKKDILHGREAQRSDPADRIDLDAICATIGETGMGRLQNRYTTAAINNRIQRTLLETARLPIPVLLSEEALHGLIWPGFTIFPQQIALAGTFEPALAFLQGRAIATETRSTGVCETWLPVLDLARDPRRGRECHVFLQFHRQPDGCL